MSDAAYEAFTTAAAVVDALYDPAFLPIAVSSLVDAHGAEALMRALVDGGVLECAGNWPGGRDLFRVRDDEADAQRMLPVEEANRA